VLWKRKILLSVVVIILAGGTLVSVAFLLYGRSQTCESAVTYQYESQRPPGGYLIIASAKGFNDSVDHGVPSNSWPVIDVKKCAQVSITTCNTDIQAHGFQISHYFDSRVVSLAPGQCLTVSFVADVTGTFRIYCNIFCTVHWAMQSGQLVVS
jgi:hypothetical protein